MGLNEDFLKIVVPTDEYVRVLQMPTPLTDEMAGPRASYLLGADALIEQLARLSGLNLRRRWRVFYSPFTRSEASNGPEGFASSSVIAVDVDGYKVVETDDDDAATLNWADVDKRQAEGLPAVRTRCSKLGLVPSAVVATGGGLHLYSLLDERVDCTLAADLTRRLSVALELPDAPRGLQQMLALPGTWTTKRLPPRRVAVTHLDPRRTYSLAELGDTLPGAPTFTPRKPTLHQDRGPTVDVWSLIETDHALSELYMGRGRTRPDGDHSASGYDMALATRLARLGFSESVITDVIARRRANDRKSSSYASRTAARAVRFAEARPAAGTPSAKRPAEGRPSARPARQGGVSTAPEEG